MGRRQSWTCSFLLVLLLAAAAPTVSFHLSSSPRIVHRPEVSWTRRSVAVAPPPFDDASSNNYVLSKEDCQPLLRLGKDEKVINAFGLWCLAVSLLTGPLWMAAMALVQHTVDAADPTHAAFDRTGKLWAKTWLTLTNCYPTISGSLPPAIDKKGQACLYVANHASWLDIPVLCTVLDPVFKFIAKGELRKVPCIGQQLAGVRRFVYISRGLSLVIIIRFSHTLISLTLTPSLSTTQGHHILIDRDDRKSQLRTFKEGLAWLQQGVPIMAFPEGMRSSDGRLRPFKKGLFSLAVKANVPIVPLTIQHTHAVMPTYSFFPVQSGRGKIHVHIGEAIWPSATTSEADLERRVRQEFLAHLPTGQRPLLIAKDEAAAETAQAAVPIV